MIVESSVTIVVPVYQESCSLRSFYVRLNAVVKKFDNIKWRFIFVNDGSTDDSLSILRELAALDGRISVVDFSRNFGKEIALTAGVFEAGESDAVISLDADLQHPPEIIPKLIEAWMNGSDVVVTVRKSFLGQPLLKKIGSRVFHWLINKTSDVRMVPNSTDFRMYDKKVIDAFKSATEQDRIFRGIIDWLGFKSFYVEFDAPEREGGSSSFSYRAMLRLAINGLTSFSLWPLKLVSYLGFLTAGLSGFLLLWMLISNAAERGVAYTPLAMVVVANTFLSGIVLVSIGLVAHYIGRIHTQVIGRPLYVIRERINFK